MIRGMKVSVLISNYNYARFLNQCIESVLNQTYENIEIIVYDDGSKDNSLEVLKKFEDKIKVISNLNYGKHHSFNQGNSIYKSLIQSTGEIIMLLDADDYFYPNKVEKVVNTFLSDEELVMVQHRMSEVDVNNKLTGKINKQKIIICNKVHNQLKYIRNSKKSSNFFMQTSALSFRRNCIEKLLPMYEDEFENVCIDMRLPVEAIYLGRFFTISEPLTYYRVHGVNHSNINSNRNYFNTLLNQYKDFLNFVAQKYKKPALINKVTFFNKLRLIFYVLFSSIEWNSKKIFFRDYFFKISNSYKKL